MANISSFLGTSSSAVYGSLKRTDSASYPSNITKTISVPGKLIGATFSIDTLASTISFTLTIDGVARTYTIGKVNGTYTCPYFVFRYSGGGGGDGFIYFNNLRYNTCSVTNNTTSYIRLYYMDKI